jgi:hypothetical protein
MAPDANSIENKLVLPGTDAYRVVSPRADPVSTDI